MAKNPEERRDRYNVSGNAEAQYVDAAQTVLRSKLGITDLAALQTVEEQALARAYRFLLKEVRTDTRLTCELLQHIHARIFGDLYEWAGHWRTVWINKPGTTWPAPDFLEQHMRAFEADVLNRYSAHTLHNDKAFCSAVGEIQGEFLVIHPFREGNARAIKLATDLLAAQTGRPLLLYEQSDEAQQQYVEAAKAAFKHHYNPMVEIIRRALARRRIALEVRSQPPPQLLGERRKALNNAVALGYVQNPLDPFGLVAKPRVSLFKRRSFSEVGHITIVPCSHVPSQRRFSLSATKGPGPASLDARQTRPLTLYWPFVSGGGGAMLRLNREVAS